MLTRKQNHLKRLLQEYMNVLNVETIEELSEITLDNFDTNSDLNTNKSNIFIELMEEASLYYSEELKYFLTNKDKFNPMMQELIENTYCKDWF